MKTKLIPTGLGQPVRPFIRIFAALIGLAGLITLVLYAALIYFGTPGYRLELGAMPMLLFCAVFAAYGIPIAFRGKGARGITSVEIEHGVPNMAFGGAQCQADQFIKMGRVQDRLAPALYSSQL